MVKIRVAEYLDSEGREALLEICSGEFTVYAFACPFLGAEDSEKVTLYALGAFNVGPCTQWHLPQRSSNIYFAHKICAEIIDIKERRVRLGEIDIILDTSIDSEFPVGSLITFTVSRLDY